MISENSYMDDIVDSVPHKDLAKKVTRDAGLILNDAGLSERMDCIGCEKCKDRGREL